MFLRKPSPSPATPQSQPLDSRQIPNEAGGYVFGVDRWEVLDRFLTIGTEGGTYYVGQERSTERATAFIADCLAANGSRVVTEAVDVSRAARAVKHDYAIYVLALALADQNVTTRRAAYLAIPQMCRTASSLFQLLSYLKGRRGWSMGLRCAIARWYDETPVEQLAYQLVKYRDRNGFTHRDAMRLAHPHAQPGDAERNALYAWAVGKSTPEDPRPTIVNDYEAAKAATDIDVNLAKRLPREALPTAWLNDARVWEALLYGDGRGMPLTALLRNLGNLSKNGVLVANSEASKFVVGRLRDVAYVESSRVHPFAIYLARAVYASGKSVMGSGSWAPSGAIVDALDDAFVQAFGNVKPTEKRILVAVDVSASMTRACVANTPLTAAHVATAMAFITARVEPKASVICFDCDERFDRRTCGRASQFAGRGIYPVQVAGDERLRDFARRLDVGGGGTDCALPFHYASVTDLDVEAVVTYTDSETWAGQKHPQAALETLRAKLRHRVRAVIASTTATESSVADPKDRDVLQIAGFDASAPTAIADFLVR